MKTARDILDRNGIQLRSHREGNQKTLCPRCSHIRKHKRDPCLSVLIDGLGVQYCCHNCEFQGGEYFDEADTRPGWRGGIRTPRDRYRSSRSVGRLYR